MSGYGSLPTVTTPGPVLPTPAASFAWSNFPSTIDTCASATLNWDYSGPQETLQFLLVPNGSPPTPRAISRKRASNTTVTLTNNVDAAASSWTWPKANFTAGQYVVEALGTNVTVASPTFTIANGADTSCLSIVAIVTLSATSTATLSPEPSDITPIPTASVRRAANAGVIAGGTVAGVVILIIALLGYRVWARRRRQRRTRSRYRTEATHRDLPSLDVASGIQTPLLTVDLGPPLTEKGFGTELYDSIVAVDSPLTPNRRPSSSLLYGPHAPVPPYTSYASTRERETTSPMDASTIGSRSSVALSYATSTGELMRTFSSSFPPSYATGPSPPPSYATDATHEATTPQSARWSYASSS